MLCTRSDQQSVYMLDLYLLIVFVWNEATLCVRLYATLMLSQGTFP